MQLQEKLYRTPNEIPNRVVSTQALPEGQIESGGYADKGCELAPSCLACPFPVCELHEGKNAVMERAERNSQILELIAAGTTHASIAKRFGVSRRQILRIAKGAKS
jgi:DNA-binding NarL/FixJ family response regulator